MLVKYLDAYLGLVSVLFDSDTNRRSLYGKAGAFRLQPWGVEYRSLSSSMMSSKELLSIVYDQINRAINAFNRNKPLPEYLETQRAINQSNVELAKNLIKTYDIFDLNSNKILDQEFNEFIAFPF